MASIHRLPRHVQFRLRGQRAVESFIGCEHNFFRCRQRVRVGRLLAQLLRQHQIVRVPKVKDELRPIEAGSRVFQQPRRRQRSSACAAALLRILCGDRPVGRRQLRRARFASHLVLSQRQQPAHRYPRIVANRHQLSLGQRQRLLACFRRRGRSHLLSRRQRLQ